MGYIIKTDSRKKMSLVIPFRLVMGKYGFYGCRCFRNDEVLHYRNYPYRMGD